MRRQKRGFHFLKPRGPFLLGILWIALCLRNLIRNSVPPIRGLRDPTDADHFATMLRGRRLPNFSLHTAIGEPLRKIVQMTAQVLRQSRVGGAHRNFYFSIGFEKANLGRTAVVIRNRTRMSLGEVGGAAGGSITCSMRAVGAGSGAGEVCGFPESWFGAPSPGTARSGRAARSNAGPAFFVGSTRVSRSPSDFSANFCSTFEMTWAVAA